MRGVITAERMSVCKPSDTYCVVLAELFGCFLSALACLIFTMCICQIVASFNKCCCCCCWLLYGRQTRLSVTSLASDLSARWWSISMCRHQRRRRRALSRSQRHCFITYVMTSSSRYTLSTHSEPLNDANFIFATTWPQICCRTSWRNLNVQLYIFNAA